MVVRAASLSQNLQTIMRSPFWIMPKSAIASPKARSKFFFVLLSIHFAPTLRALSAFMHIQNATFNL
jgi:hypothetical protein